MRKRIFNLICKNCNEPFKTRASNIKYCNNCYEERECSNINCNNIVKDIFVNDKSNHFCSKKCRYEYITYIKTKPGNCTKCGKFSERRDSTGRCSNCISKQVKTIDLSNRTYTNICLNCGNNFKSKAPNTKYCDNCYEERKCDNCNKTLDRKIFKGHTGLVFCDTFCQLQYKSKINTKPGNCTICNKFSEQRDSVGRCSNCITKQVKNSWKDINLDDKISRLKGINSIPSFSKMKSTCSKHLNEQLEYYSAVDGKYICWSCYKDRFINNTSNANFINKIRNDYLNSFMHPTFRNQDSDSWKNAYSAFEQSLIDKNIGWFVYIKFYLDKYNNIKPLVVGKSGSLLVNTSGSDVSFSTNIKHGPSRQFLYDTKQEWDKTQILIIPCDLEDEAYKIEKAISDKYNLFYS